MPIAPDTKYAETPDGSVAYQQFGDGPRDLVFVSSEKTPNDIKYTGKMEGTLRYEEAYQITTPAGTFDTVLIKIDLKIHVGPAHVEDTQYTFFASGVGKVAEIEAQRIAAVLIYHSHSDTAKVLVIYPKR